MSEQRKNNFCKERCVIDSLVDERSTLSLVKLVNAMKDESFDLNYVCHIRDNQSEAQCRYYVRLTADSYCFEDRTAEAIRTKHDINLLLGYRP